MRAVFDTNVLVSGLLFSGSTSSLFQLVHSKQVTLCFTPKILQEIQRVFLYPHLQPALKKNWINVDQTMAFLKRHAEMVEDIPVFRLVKADPTDDKFINCAFLAEAKWIVSGDKHLLRLKMVGDIRIVTPAQFLKEIL